MYFGQVLDKSRFENSLYQFFELIIHKYSTLLDKALCKKSEPKELRVFKSKYNFRLKDKNYYLEMTQKILLQPIKLGDVALKNKLVMAPLTRCRADYQTGIPTDLHVEYYTQRASAGLVVSEAAWIHPRGHSYLGAAGIYNKDQVKGWKKVTQSVHDKGGKIFCQLFHGGRSAHPDQIGGKRALAPSAIAVEGDFMAWTGSAMKRIGEFPPDEMTKDDIKELIEATENAGKLALEAGFDGVELHNANGYIFDEFIKDHTNRRTDEYGGNIENRSRLTLDVLGRLAKVWGPGRVGVKLSPVGRYLDMYDSDPKTHIRYLARKISELNLAYICYMEYDGTPNPVRGGKGTEQIPNCAKEFRSSTSIQLMTNGGLSFEEGERRVKEGEADLVCMGAKYVSNPDLLERYKNGWPLTPPDPNTFYTPGPQGYTDYPRYDQTHKTH